MKISNQFMNDFEISVKNFEPVLSDWDFSGGITYTLTTKYGSDDFFEWVGFDGFNDRWKLETVDTHLFTNEMIKLYKLFELKDETVACVRDHHYPTDEIQEYLQNWLDKNTSNYKGIHPCAHPSSYQDAGNLYTY